LGVFLWARYPCTRLEWRRHSLQRLIDPGLLVEAEREFFIDNLLVRIHFIIVMIRWTGLAPWEFKFPFPGSLTSTFLKPYIYLPVEAELTDGTLFRTYLAPLTLTLRTMSRGSQPSHLVSHLVATRTRVQTVVFLLLQHVEQACYPIHTPATKPQ